MKLQHAGFLTALWLVFLLPVAVIVIYAVAGLWEFPHILPSELSLRALRFVIGQSGRIIESIGMSFAYSMTTVLVTLLICVLPASVFARSNFPLKNALETLLLAPALLPSIAFSMGVHFLFIKARLIDSFPGVVSILAVFSYPYMLRALIAGFTAYGREYEICAENLGAGAVRRILRVDLPLLLPSIVAGGTVVFLISFSEYFLVFLIGGGAVASFTGYLFPFLNSADRQIGSMMALIFLIVPIMLFLLVDISVTRRYRGMGI